MLTLGVQWVSAQIIRKLDQFFQPDRHIVQPDWHIVQPDREIVQPDREVFQRKRSQSEQQFSLWGEKGVEKAQGARRLEPHVVFSLFRELKLKKMSEQDNLLKQTLKFRPVKTKKSKKEKENIDWTLLSCFILSLNSCNSDYSIARWWVNQRINQNFLYYFNSKKNVKGFQRKLPHQRKRVLGCVGFIGTQRHCSHEYTHLKPQSNSFFILEHVGYIKKVASALHHQHFF